MSGASECGIGATCSIRPEVCGISPDQPIPHPSRTGVVRDHTVLRGVIFEYIKAQSLFDAAAAEVAALV